MKKTLIQLALLISISFALKAQTQKIAHKSHSGTDATFSVNVNAGSNFGLSPEIYIMHELKRDSLKIQAFLKTEGGLELMHWLKQYKEEKELSYEQLQALKERLGENEVGMLIQEALRYEFQDTQKFLFRIHDQNELIRRSKGFKFYQNGNYEKTASIAIGLSLLLAGAILYKHSSVA